MIDIAISVFVMLAGLAALGWAMSLSKPDKTREEQIAECEKQRAELTVKIYQASTDSEREDLLGKRFRLDHTIEMMKRW